MFVEISLSRAAMRAAEHLPGTFPLSLRVIREMHQVLLQGVRGQHKAPGEYRRIPNWIGPASCAIEQARIIPIGAE